MARRPASGWAAVNLHRPNDEPSIWHVGRTRGQVHLSMGKMWNRDDPAAGWKVALKRGWRVVKVEVRVAP